MLELIWILGIILTVLVFGVTIGLAMGFKGLSKKVAVGTAVGYGVGILILTYTTSLYVESVYKLINDYNFVIFTIIAIILIFTSFHTIRKWKINDEDNEKTSKILLIALYPCCLGAVTATIVLTSPITDISAATIGLFTALFLSISIVAFYFASGTVVRITKKPYSILIGNFMLFVGFYFLASAIVIPNISTVLQSPMSPMDIPSMVNLVYAVVFVIILAFAGFYLTKKKSNLIH